MICKNRAAGAVNGGGVFGDVVVVVLEVLMLVLALVD